MVTRIGTIAVVLVALAAWVLPVQADVILYENFDSLTVGTNPDDNNPAGGWLFPPNYIMDGVSEGSDLGIFTIVATSDFDPDSPGNSFRIQSKDTIDNHHVTNLFNQTIQGDTPVVIQFDTFVPSGGGGGSMYVSGDNGGGGYSNVTDRGPQLSFLDDGTVAAIGPDGNFIVFGPYTFDTWLTVQIQTSVSSGTYDVYMGLRGGSLDLLASNVPFRSIGVQFFDRFSFAHFTIDAPSNQYYDEVWVLTNTGD
jgi:hypothetical protein